jgi:hypothetical protein
MSKKALEVVGWSNRQAILCLAFLLLFIVLPTFGLSSRLLASFEVYQEY